jgi:hypothetical protein
VVCNCASLDVSISVPPLFSSVKPSAAEVSCLVPRSDLGPKNITLGTGHHRGVHPQSNGPASSPASAVRYELWWSICFARSTLPAEAAESRSGCSVALSRTLDLLKSALQGLVGVPLAAGEPVSTVDEIHPFLASENWPTRRARSNCQPLPGMKGAPAANAHNGSRGTADGGRSALNGDHMRRHHRPHG